MTRLDETSDRQKTVAMLKRNKKNECYCHDMEGQMRNGNIPVAGVP